MATATITAIVTIMGKGIIKMAQGPQDNSARQSRLVALVIAGTMILWMAGQQIGAELGLPLKYTLLLDLAALAGFIWALVVTYQIWRARRR